MDCGARLGGGRGAVVEALPAAVRSGSGNRAAVARSVFGWRYPVYLAVNSQAAVHFRDSRFANKQAGLSLTVKATSAESNKCEHRYSGSPLQPQSPPGKFLKGVLRNQPDNFDVAAAKQLKELATDRNDALARWEHSVDASEKCLHGRIAEMKELRCQTAVEEVMYMLIVHNFSQIKVPMVPRLTRMSSGRNLDLWPSKDRELESIHCPQVLELIKDHLSNIFGPKGGDPRSSSSSGKWPTAEIKRLQLGRLYAASILYGYFLKSAQLRHQLECSLARTDEDYPLGFTICVPHLDRQLSNLEDDLVVIGNPFDAVSSLSPMVSESRRPKKLRNYVLNFDTMAVQLCAKLRSQEAADVIESHCLAIFGAGEAGMADGEDDTVAVTFTGLKRLVLEAIAFGTFLWEAERYVDSIYLLKENRLGVRQEGG